MEKLKLFTISLILLITAGCNVENPIATPRKSDPQLPLVKRIQTIPDTTAIAFEWMPYNEDGYVAGYNIYRLKVSNSDNKEGNLKLVARINDRLASHYVDSGLEPETTYKYRFTLFTKDNRESLGSDIVTAKTLALIQPLHYIISIGELANKTKLLWRPHTDPRVSGYIIERNDLYNQEWERVGELEHRLDVEFIDDDLEINKLYKYRIRAKTFEGLLSEPSQIIDVKTKPLPKPVLDITASSDLPKEIKISWRESDEKEVTIYKIYRSSGSNGYFSMIDEVKTNFYFDKLGEDGKQMFYKVSAVDKDGLESVLNQLPIMGNTLFKPKSPIITKIESSKTEISIKWEPTDPRSLRYKVIRKSGSILSKKEVMEYDVDKTSYVDSQNLAIDVVYSYQVIAIDKDGVESLPTEESQISLKK
jgi:hypothetical protein